MTASNAHAAPATPTAWWPRLIMATFVLFAGYIGYMVRQALRTDVDLVSADYYQKEIAYQEHINQLNQTRELPGQVEVVHAAAARQLSLVFPPGPASKEVRGQVYFFRPSDARMDFEVPLQLNTDYQQHIPTDRLTKGRWQIKLQWQNQGRDYYLQKDITI